MIKPGEEWGKPSAAAPDIEVAGSDADLAAAVAGRPGVLVRFRPDAASDLALAVGLNASSDVPDGANLGVEVALDLLQIRGAPGAVNMIEIGAPADALRRFARRFVAEVLVDGKSIFDGPCTTVVISTGQFLRGLDVIPRGHPGDGRAEVQIYALHAGERHAVRRRLATGTHVPHPRITQRTGAQVSVTVDRPVRLEIDGRTAGTTELAEIDVVPGAYRLLL